MSSLQPNELLSLTLLQQEVERLNSQHSMVQGDTHGDCVAASLCEEITSFSEKLLSCSDAITSHEAAEAYISTSLVLLSSMQRLTAVMREVDGHEEKETEGRNGHIGDITAHVRPLLSRCTEAWAKWYAQVPRLPHFYASCITVRIPAILTSASAYSSFQAWRGFFEKTACATRVILLHAARTLPPDVGNHCLPPRSLLPPWTLLITCAQLAWAADRLRGVVGTQKSDTTSSNEAAVGNNQLGSAGAGATFLEIQERVEAAHADQLVREVLLFSYDSIDWKVGNEVPNVKSVAPSVWCLFLRCRSLAMYGLTKQKAAPHLPYFQDCVARRLTARVLQHSIDAMCSCLERNVIDMHKKRVEQLASRDVPALVLLTRLWYLYLQPYPELLKAIHSSLVQLVHIAVGLFDPATVEEVHVADTGVHNGSREHVQYDEAEEQEITTRGAARARCFLDVVWSVEPLQELEVLMDATGIPWSPAFPRAAAMQAVLDGCVVVSSVE
ncbi:hypothetical protein ABL78_6061 [Leptomonas seymouri]|uniref:Uncharacterized protein n=1 Tax=Leptomonas seymouri TaxID=5684 RepID=A0A0N0P448_LEPSE|nr:hypothetical protein ABL78_6061 [Leptomonas seymouri]|eukprot:KPI84879.1 hypothetical protein ABL78_6061 [Leptomonas seymouri]